MSATVPVGVIEGFYGQPWSHEERLRCIDQIGQWGWNTYVWAAKLEPRHRERWEEPFTTEELEQFKELSTRHESVNFIVGLTPGSGATSRKVIDKIEPAVSCGATGVSLCFDDMPVLDAARQHREIANDVADAFGLPVWVVPTHYAGTTGSPYLDMLCDGLDDRISIMWTGEMVVNDEIRLDQALARTEATGNRRPLVWDNAPVNDALMTSHLHLGPFTGREIALREACSGWLWNPMQSQQASMVMLESAAAWWRGEDPIDAWESVVDRDGWRPLAEATSYRGEHHWPGEGPQREWWEAVRDMPDHDPAVSSWVASAKLGATLALAALDVLEARDEDLTVEATARAMRTFMTWTSYRTQSWLTFGTGPRRRPMATQNDQGKFVLTSGSMVDSESLVDQLVTRALKRLSR